MFSAIFDTVFLIEKFHRFQRIPFSPEFTCLVIIGCVAAPSQTELLKIGYKQSRTREWQKS